MSDTKKLTKNLREIGTYAMAHLSARVQDDLWVGITINEIQEILEQQSRQPDEDTAKWMDKVHELEIELAKLRGTQTDDDLVDWLDGRRELGQEELGWCHGDEEKYLRIRKLLQAKPEKPKDIDGTDCLCPHCEKGYNVIFDIREDFSSETGRIKCPHCGFVVKIISIQVRKLPKVVEK